jgi:hypothetical protein
MDSDKLFKAYLATWPDNWITWPVGGKAKMQDFFADDSSKALMDDLLSYVMAEYLEGHRSPFCCSEWLTQYFHTVRGRNLVKRAKIARHEPLMVTTAFNIEPLKGLMDGFLEYVIEKEIRPCLK